MFEFISRPIELFYIVICFSLLKVVVYVFIFSIPFFILVAYSAYGVIVDETMSEKIAYWTNVVCVIGFIMMFMSGNIIDFNQKAKEWNDINVKWDEKDRKKEEACKATNDVETTLIYNLRIKTSDNKSYYIYYEGQNKKKKDVSKSPVNTTDIYTDEENNPYLKTVTKCKYSNNYYTEYEIHISESILNDLDISKIK